MSWKLSSTHPGIYWNILESHFFIAVRTLYNDDRISKKEKRGGCSVIRACSLIRSNTVLKK